MTTQPSTSTQAAKQACLRAKLGTNLLDPRCEALVAGRAAALKHNAACLEKRETIFDMPSHRLDCIVSEAGARAMPKDTKWRNWRYETVP